MKADSYQDVDIKRLLQEKEEQIATLETRVQEQAQTIKLLAKRQSSDTVTQFSYADKNEGKSVKSNS